MRPYEDGSFIASGPIVDGLFRASRGHFPEWCEQITGVDLEKKYVPFWAVLFSVSFDGDAIR